MVRRGPSRVQSRTSGMHLLATVLSILFGERSKIAYAGARKTSVL